MSVKISHIGEFPGITWKITWIDIMVLPPEVDSKRIWKELVYLTACVPYRWSRQAETSWRSFEQQKWFKILKLEVSQFLHPLSVSHKSLSFLPIKGIVQKKEQNQYKLKPTFQSKQFQQELAMMGFQNLFLGGISTSFPSWNICCDHVYLRHNKYK